MGAGRGAQRRAKATAPVADNAKAMTNWVAWRLFVQGNSLRRVTIGDYYKTRGPDHQPGEVTAAEIKKTMGELFRDWITTGALTLPKGRSVDEYEFRMGGEVANNWNVLNMVFFADKRSGVEGITIRCTPDMLEERIGAVGWKYVMRELAKIMNGERSGVAIKDAAGNTVGFAS